MSNHVQTGKNKMTYRGITMQTLILIQNDNANPMVIDYNNSKINYFLLGHSQETDRRVGSNLVPQL